MKVLGSHCIYIYRKNHGSLGPGAFLSDDPSIHPALEDRQVQLLMDDLDLPPDRANLFEPCYFIKLRNCWESKVQTKEIVMWKTFHFSMIRNSHSHVVVCFSELSLRVPVFQWGSGGWTVFADIGCHVRGRSMPFAMMACDCVNSFLRGCIQKVCWGGVTWLFLTWQAHHFADITFFAATIVSGRGNGIHHVMDVWSSFFFVGIALVACAWIWHMRLAWQVEWIRDPWDCICFFSCQA